MKIFNSLYEFNKFIKKENITCVETNVCSNSTYAVIVANSTGTARTKIYENIEFLKQPEIIIPSTPPSITTFLWNLENFTIAYGAGTPSTTLISYNDNALISNTNTTYKIYITSTNNEDLYFEQITLHTMYTYSIPSYQSPTAYNKNIVGDIGIEQNGDKYIITLDTNEIALLPYLNGVELFLDYNHYNSGTDHLGVYPEYTIDKIETYIDPTLDFILSQEMINITIPTREVRPVDIFIDGELKTPGIYQYIAGSEHVITTTDVFPVDYPPFIYLNYSYNGVYVFNDFMSEVEIPDSITITFITDLTIDAYYGSD